MGLLAYCCLFMVIVRSQAYVEIVSDTTGFTSLLSNEYKDLQSNKIQPVKNALAQKQAEHEGNFSKQPYYQSKVFRHCSRSILVLVPAAVEFEPSKQTQIEAFQTMMQQAKKMLDTWLIKTDVTGFGITCLIFHPDESLDTTEKTYCQFFIATTNGNEQNLLEKGLKEFRNTAREQINNYRKQHGSNTLDLYNDGKANPISRQPMKSSAQSHVDNLISSRSPMQYSEDALDGMCQESLHINASEFGVLFGGTAATYIFETWYNEFRKYNFDDPDPSKCDDFWNFVLMLWDSSSCFDIGIGYGFKIGGDQKEINVVYIVARYFQPSASPEALTKENYLANVKPRI